MGTKATKFAAGSMALAVLICTLAVVFAEPLAANADAGVTMAYEEKLFDTDTVLTIDIQIDETDFAELLDNATDEEYYVCDVVINGETFQNVGIRAKGNTSLSNISSDPTTDRYSWKLEFDHYIDGQTCWGLDKLILNNNYADATNMKEALIYDMFAYLGADASLYNYAEISVNGEYWGVYLALEAVEDGFLTRNYGATDGELYKPDNMEIGGGMGDNAFDGENPFGDIGDLFGNNENGDRPSVPDFSTGDGTMTPPDGENSNIGAQNGGGFQSDGSQEMGSLMGDPRGGSMNGFTPGQNTTGGESTDTDVGTFSGGRFPQNGGFDREVPDFGSFEIDIGGGFMSGNGTDLNYTDDDLDSYSAIWEGEITSTTDKDHTRVVTALEKIAAGEDLETYMDTDNLVRYMAAHIFSVNEDSLSGMMAHNYYLYESNGKLNLIPWDYNLAFGGMSGGNATSMVNDPIDDPFDATDFFDTLLADPTYYTAYRENLEKLVEYVENGAFDAFYNRVRSQIDTLVETDPTAFYTYDEYVTAVETLYTVVKLRAQSIAGQLDGTIPSTAEEQRTDDSSLIDASAITLSVMGVMNGGKDREDMPGGAFGDGTTVPEKPDGTGDGATIPEKPDGTGDGATVPEKPDGTGDGAIVPEMSGTTGEDNAASGDGSANNSTNDSENDSSNGSMDSDANSSVRNAEVSANGNGESGNFPQRADFASGIDTAVTKQNGMRQNLVWLIGCALICSGSILFAFLYKKHPRHG